MSESITFNEDCLEGMKRYPDGFFSLAVVDPVYGGVTQGGYMKPEENGKLVGTGAAKRNSYHLSIWEQEKTGEEYFSELFRISKNQVIWGGVITSKQL